MSMFWKFTSSVLFTLAVIALPVINFVTNSELAGNLANLVLALLIVLLFLGVVMTLEESTKAATGKLSEEKMAKFLETHKRVGGIENTLRIMARCAFVVGVLVMAACGYEWFAFFILATWIFLQATMSIASDRADLIISTNVSRAS